jgi:hypothetical protein
LDRKFLALAQGIISRLSSKSAHRTLGVYLAPDRLMGSRSLKLADAIIAKDDIKLSDVISIQGFPITRGVVFLVVKSLINIMFILRSSNLASDDSPSQTSTYRGCPSLTPEGKW